MSDTLFLQSGLRIQNYKNAEDGSVSLWEELKTQFDWIDTELYRAVSESYNHEFLTERVTRTCISTSRAEEMLNKKVATAHRLFGRDSGTSVLYVTELFDQDKPSWMSAGSFPIGTTSSFEEYGKPCRAEMLLFSEVFFVAPQDELTSFYGINIEGTNDSTVYSAIVSNNTPVSFRRYTNFTSSDLEGVLTNWQSLYVYFCKNARRMDLVRELFSKPFVLR
jgi:hypothetical protein